MDEKEKRYVMFVKYYENLYDQIGRKIPFKEFVDLIKNPSITNYSQITLIRSEQDKIHRQVLKRQLPIITPSVIPISGRKSEVEEYTNIICFDFDHKPGLTKIKHKLMKIPYVICYFNSPSGDGIKVFVLTNFNSVDEFDLQWKLISDDLGYRINEMSDFSRTDINGSCFLSYDENIYVNPSPEFFIPNDETDFEWEDSFNYRYDEDPNELYERVCGIIDKSISDGIDLTIGYQNWRNIGFAIADAFGKDGEELFQKISSIHPEYNREETSELYSICCREFDDVNRITISTLFYYAKERGITFSKKNNYEKPF